MLQMESLVQVADNTGARTAKMIGVIGKSGTDQAHIGDIITCHIRESIPTASVKKGTVVKAVVVRTAAPIRRDDGSVLRFDSNAVVVIDKDNNPFILELNTLPGMTEHSLVPKAAAKMGVSFPELCDRILSSAKFDRMK